MSVVFAVVGALLLAVGAGLVYFPAGVLVAGVAFTVAAYVVKYLEVHGEDPRTSRP